jgi:hypothetical protein
MGRGNFTIDDVGALLKKKVFTVFLTGIVVYLMVVAGMLLFYIPGIYIAICMVFFPFVIVFEDTGLGDGISRSFKVANQKWWLTFGSTLVFGMIIGFSLYIFLIPIYVVIIIAAIGGTQLGTGSVILIVLFVMLYFVAYMFAIALQQVLVATMYFNITGEKEGLGLQERINLINQENPDVFTVEKNPEKPEEKKEEVIPEEQNKKPEDIDRFKENDENNRFLDDDNNRFKPKF